MLILIVASGPDKGRLYELLDQQTIILGREGDQIKLNDRKVSREHTRLWCEGGRWYIEDLGSRHGTYRNHKRIESKTSVKDGDYIQIGNTVMVLARMPAEAAERLSLLGTAPSASEVAGVTPGRLGRFNVPSAVLLTAAAVVIAVTIAMAMRTSNRVDELQRELVQRQSDSFHATHEMLAELGQRERPDVNLDTAVVQQQDSLLRQILANVQSQREQETLLADIHDALKHRDAQRDGILDTLMANIEAQAAQTRLLEDIHQNLTRQDDAVAMAPELQTQLQALAQAAQGNQTSLQDIRDLLAALQPAELDEAEQLADSSVSEWLEAAAARDAQLTDQLAGILERLEQTRATNEQLAQLSEQIEQQRAMQDAASEQMFTRLAQMQQAVAGQEQLLAAMDEIRQAMPSGDDQRMQQVLARLDQVSNQVQHQPLLAAIDDLRQMMPVKNDESMQQVFARLDQLTNTAAADRTQMLAAIDELKQAMPTAPDDAGDTQQLLQQVLAQLDQMRSTDDTAQVLAAIDQLKTAMPAVEDQDKPFDQVIAMLRDLDSGPAAHELMAAIEQADALNRQHLEDRLRRIEEQLAAISGQSLTAAEQARQLQVQQQSTAELLDELRQGMAQRDAIDTLRSELQALTELARVDEKQPELLDVLKLIQANQTSQAQLLQSVQRLQDLPQLTEHRLARIEQAIAQLPHDDNNVLLRDVLAQIRNHAAPGLDDMRLAIRGEIESALREYGAVADTALAHGQADTSSENDADQPGPVALAGAERPAPRSAAMSRPSILSAYTTTTQDQRRTPGDQPMTEMERAYKLAFETGQPVTIGAGVINPITGEASEGRTLDPAAARAAGIKRWQDWYMMDDFSERMRLQEQAQEYRYQGDAGRNLIRLPAIQTPRLEDAADQAVEEES